MRSVINVIFKNSKRSQQLRGKTKREAILYAISFLIVFAFLAATMVLFSIELTTRLIKINQAYTFVNLLLLMNFIILFTKSIFESLNVLYFAKDLKVLLRMPIKPGSILNAKLLNMIISEYQMEFIMLAIPMIVYGILTNAGCLFYLYMFMILLVLPIIPILITTLLIAIIMRFTNVIKNKSKVMYITIMLATFLIGFVTMGTGGSGEIPSSSVENIVLQVNGIAETIADYFPLIRPIMNILLNYNNINGLNNLLIYLLENIVCYVLIVYIVSKIYLRGAIGTIINSQKDKKNRNKKLKLKDFKQKGKIQAYLIKELKVMARAPIFLIQCLIIPIVYPITILGAVFLLLSFADSMGVDIVGMLYNMINTPIGAAIFLAIGQVFNMMNFASIIAISKEAKNAVLVKYIPIDLAKQFKLKTIIGSSLNFFNGIIVIICYYIFTKNIINSILMIISLELMNIFGEKLKLLIDLRNPKLNWNSEYTMMKQNTNVMYILFYTLAIDIVLLLIGNIIKINSIFFTLMIIIGIIVNIIINSYVKGKQSKIFGRLYA